MKYIRAYVNPDAISSYPNVKGQIEFFYENTENGDMEYGIDYLSYRNEDKALEYCIKLNSLDITTWEQYNKYERDNINMLYKHYERR